MKKVSLLGLFFISIFALSACNDNSKGEWNTTLGTYIKKTTPSQSISESISRSKSESESESVIKESESLSESQSKSEVESESKSVANSISESNSIATSVSKSNQEIAASEEKALQAQETTTTSQAEQSQNTSGYTNSDGWAIAQAGWCFVSHSNIYYSHVKYPADFRYTSIEEAQSKGARQPKRGNQYAQP